LNMSKEVLSGFGLLNEKFEGNVEKTAVSNTQYLLSLQQKAIENPAKFGPLYENALDLERAATEFSSYLETLKTGMLATVKDPSDYEVMDLSNYLDAEFFKGERLTEEGEEFISRIDSFKNELLRLIPDENETLRASVLERFETGDREHQVMNRDGQKLGWLNYHFEGFPLVASLTKISAMQSDIEGTEQEVLQSLLEGQLTREMSMTNYTTLLEQSKGAYFSDESFDGAIVLGRKDGTTRPNEVDLKLDGVTLSADKDFFIEEGRVRLSVAAGNPGDHKLEGRLLFLESGAKTEVPINLSFSTIAKPNTAVISADKMNVVYRGVDNPMTISIPGIPNNKVKATAPGLKSLGGSSYTVRPSRGAFLRIEAKGELPDGSQVTTTTQFRIKDVPAPSGTVRGEFGSLRMSRSELEKTIVGAELVDFDFDLPIAVSGFKMKIPNQPTLEIKGSRMDSRAVSAIRRASRGDIVRIFDIKTYPTTDTSYFLKPAAQVIVEIIN
jgi:gliding motility-associated protein GldM